MPTPKTQILVCVNERPPEKNKPCCAPRGGLELYRRFKDRVRELGLRDEVMVTRTGCLKHCSHGIVVALWPDNQWYRRVSLDDVDEILQTTVQGQGQVVDRLAMPDVPWE